MMQIQNQNRILILMVLIVMLFIHYEESATRSVRTRDIMDSIKQQGAYSDHIRQLNEDRWDLIVQRIESMDKKLSKDDAQPKDGR